MDLLHEPQRGDVVTFDVCEDGVANVHRIGFTNNTVANVARIDDRDGTSLNVHASCSKPAVRIPWNGEGETAFRSGDFILFTITNGTMDMAAHVCTAESTVLGR